MIVYQVKIMIEASIHNEWLLWMQTVHIPDMIATGLISTFQIWKASNSEEIEYCFNYYFSAMEDFERYQDEYAPKLKAHPKKKFPNQFKANRQVFFQL